MEAQGEDVTNTSVDHQSQEQLFQMGVKYRDGNGATQDFQKALEYFTKAANQGHMCACVEVGVLYYNGAKGVSRDTPKVWEYLTKAANAGSAFGQNILGTMYRDGKGAPVDYQKALEWFTKSANQGDVNAMGNIGNAYKRGQGVSQDYQKAAEYYLQAHNKGNPAALARYNECQEEHKKIVGEILKTRNVEDWTVNEVCYWLNYLKLSQDYSSLLQTNNVTGRVLLTMTSNEWKELGITNFGDLQLLKCVPNTITLRPTSHASSAPPALSPPSTAGTLSVRGIPKGKQSERSQSLEGLEEVTYKPIIKLMDNFTTEYNCRQHMLMDLPSILPDPDVVPDLVEECLCVSESCLQHLPDGVPLLSADEALAIAVFTFDLEDDDVSKNLFYVLNKVLRQRDPAKISNLKPFLFFLIE